MKPNFPQYITAPDAANSLSVSPRTVISWVRSGRVIGTKLPNNRYVVLATEIERLTRPLDFGTLNEFRVEGDR